MAISVTAEEKQILAGVTIPPRPQALLDISKEAKQEYPDVSKIAKAISEDVGISAAVLQVVNSVAFRRNNQISSIHQAVMTLGIKRIFPLVKAVAIKGALPENPMLNEFWQSSSMVASACTLYANLLGKANLSDNAYMLGLFHNAGVPVMLQAFPAYQALLMRGITEGWGEVASLEVQEFKTSHTTLGALLAQQWELPKPMVEVIYYLHDIDGIFTSGELSEVGLYLLAILKLARSSVDGVIRGECNTDEWLKIQDPLLAFLNLDEVQLDEFREEVAEKLRSEG
ncbi:signal transduction protein [Shewanella denitrificans OS217]|jgi:HD-like signal output (HDOD) protein|uniref:Signal transduction protein n=1 Tax=Shewanella denitrificans (strain OS217 / ATCC BAA-1090 / DSM 15013) TaxID=318161 RepID=Q12QW3_SHEDO|nr:HDOD domain-containing protein [Shewanella denitrificans]ABE54163.1 signal transduction protein [Shewanella denitrificans OS217]